MNTIYFSNKNKIKKEQNITDILFIYSVFTQKNKIKKEELKNYLSNSPEINFSTFSYASSSVN